jgi:hypothetical protein
LATLSRVFSVAPSVRRFSPIDIPCPYTVYDASCYSTGAGIAQQYRQGLGIVLITTASRSALGPTQTPIQWVPGALSLGVKRPGREADQSPPTSAEVRNAWSYTSTPPTRIYGVVLS